MKLTAESTVFNDNAVQNKFAELVVDADGIRTEVSKKVGNNEVISRINQSAESVSIDASKVNIDGVITAINNNTTTTIDGDKITTGTLLANAVKADSGTFNTANIPNLNASKITAGDISSDRMKANAISAINADLTSATINTAHIPNLSADKITTGTISIGRIPTTARNDTYITDIDSQDGIIVKAVNGRTDGSDDTEKNYIKLNASGLDIYQGGNSVAKYGTTQRIGKDNGERIELGNNSFDVYNSSGTKVCKIFTADYGGTIDLINTESYKVYDTRVGPGQIAFISQNTSNEDWIINAERSDAEISFGYGSNDVIYIHKGNGHEAGVGSFDVWVGTGSGGDNHGVYSGSFGKWIVHMNSEEFAVIPQAGAKTGTAGNPMYVTSGGILRRNTSSSRRYKENIKSLEAEELNPNRLYDVDVKQFIYRDDYLDSDDQRYGKTIPGFIVEELKDIYPIAVTYEDGQPENWDARYLIPPMLKLIQNQKNEIDSLTERLDAFERRHNVYSN